MVQHSTQDSTTYLVPSEFPKQLDIAQVSVYGLSFLSAGLFLFLSLVNLLHPIPWQRWMGTIHCMGGMLALLVMVYTEHLAFPWLRGAGKILPQMRTLAFTETAMATSRKDKTVQAVPVSAGQQEVQAVDGTNQTGEITERVKLDELVLKIYDRIDQSWQTSPTFNQNLVYRVSTSQDGAIGNFEPLNQPAKDYTQETPLPNLLKSSETSSSNSAAPVTKFTVVFAPTGTLEVNP
ncbi:hypothetical protein [Microcoleus sp. AT3-D2]|uniref:hypothetical protein n=1 Tax=Microcoleus sp. AT3-D2 TaxID=2818612 RepID=UPI002FD582DE